MEQATKYIAIPTDFKMYGTYFNDYGETFEADTMESLWVKLEEYVKWGSDEYEQYKDMYLNMPKGRVAIEARGYYGWEVFTKINTVIGSGQEL